MIIKPDVNSANNKRRLIIQLFNLTIMSVILSSPYSPKSNSYVTLCVRSQQDIQNFFCGFLERFLGCSSCHHVDNLLVGLDFENSIASSNNIIYSSQGLFDDVWLTGDQLFLWLE